MAFERVEGKYKLYNPATLKDGNNILSASIHVNCSDVGNKAMELELYPDAIELYTVAIALRGDNAIYYCNR